MEFEGVEKKLEIQLKPSCGSLLSLPESFWYEIVKDAKAEILSKSTHSQCIAYLLSESSLFIFPSRLVMITCGQTTLVEAALSLFKKIPKDKMGFIFYERKNENFPQQQSTSHNEDIKKLSTIFNGKNVLLGEKPGNHVSLFYFSANPVEQGLDSTIEILMHGLGDTAKKLFSNGSEEKYQQKIRQKIGIEEFLPNFQIDEHVFSPQGYSLNAIKEQYYYSIHVTPNSSSYASFETNHPCITQKNETYFEDIIQNLVAVFQPKSLNTLLFCNTPIEKKIKLHGYQQTLFQHKALDFSYEAHSYNFKKHEGEKNE